MSKRLKLAGVAAILAVSIFANAAVFWSPKGVPETALDMWGSEHNISESRWALFDFVHAAGCGYCVLNAKAYQENFAEGLSAAGVRTFGVDVFEEQRDLVDYVKHNRIRFPILTEPDLLWSRLRCPGLPGQSLFHDGRPVLSRCETLTHVNYDRIRRVLRSEDSLRWGGDIRPFRPVGPLKKALNSVYEDENALLIVGDAFVADAKRFLPGLKRSVFRTKRAGDVTDSDLRRGAVYVIGSPGENAFCGRLRGKTPFEVLGDGIAFADTFLAGDDLGIWYCCPNPWNPECYLVVKTGTYPLSDRRLSYDGSQDFVIERRLDHGGERPSSLILARGIFAKVRGEWSLAAGAIDWERGGEGTQPVPASACGANGCPKPAPTALSRRSRTAEDAGGSGVVRRVAPLGVEIGAPRSWPGRFPALSADTLCWVVWDKPQGGIFVDRLGEPGWGPRQVWAQGERVPGSADLIGGGTEGAYKPAVLSDGGGACWVAWSQLERDFYQVFAARVPVVGQPKIWRISHRVNLDHHSPALARCAEGTLVLTWYAWEANARRPYYRAWDGSAWSSVGRVPTKDESQFAWYLSGANGGGGAGRWVWMQHYPSPTSVVTAKFTESGWGKPVTVADAGRYPSAAFDVNKDETRVVWQQWIREGSNATNNDWRILTSCSRGNGWSEPTEIPGCPSGRNVTPVVTVDDSSRTWVFWSHKGRVDTDVNTDPVRRTWKVLGSVYAASRWHGPYVISDPKMDSRSPAVASWGGSTWISWHQGAGTDLRVVVRRIRPVSSSRGEETPKKWATRGQTSN